MYILKTEGKIQGPEGSSELITHFYGPFDTVNEAINYRNSQIAETITTTVLKLWRPIWRLQKV